MLARPIWRGKIEEWILGLLEFTIKYIPAKAVKGQALADFLADHPCIIIGLEIASTNELVGKYVIAIMEDILRWLQDKNKNVCWGKDIDNITKGGKYPFYFNIEIGCTNNWAKYEVLILGLDILLEMGASIIEVCGDFDLGVQQVRGEYKCSNLRLIKYVSTIIRLLGKFDVFLFTT